jgi:hypothetical protein
VSDPTQSLVRVAGIHPGGNLDADAGFAGVGYQAPNSRSPEVIMLREAQRTSSDEWRRRESNPRKISIHRGSRWPDPVKISGVVWHGSIRKLH